MESVLLPEGPIPLPHNRIPEAADLLAESFREDPLNRHLFPDPEERVRAFRIIYRMLLGYFHAIGSVFMTSERMEGLMVISISGDGSNPFRLIKVGRAIPGILALPIRLMRITRLGTMVRRAKALSGAYRLLRFGYHRYDPERPYLSLELYRRSP
jgi:hypothetical protein